MLIVCAGGALAFAVAEITLGVMGFTFLPNPTEVRFGWPDPVTLKQRYRVDDRLFWAPKDYPEKIAAWRNKSPSIVFMGCSCTEFGRYDEYFVDMVRERHVDKRMDFVNVGVAGWSSYQGLQQLKRDVLPMKPKVLSIYYGWNDHWKSSGLKTRSWPNYISKTPLWKNVYSDCAWLNCSSMPISGTAATVTSGNNIEG